MFYDLFGALASLLSTYYFIRLDTKAWPIGLLATCLNGWLYWQKGIYADTCLEAFYFLSLGIGWHRWSRQKLGNQQKVLTRLLAWQWFGLIIASITMYVIIVSLLTKFSHSTIIELDAITATLSLTAQWLMCHKVIATWVLWFITDILYASIYLQKNLPIHVLLMFLYSGLAVVGYLFWSKRQQPIRVTVIQTSDVPKV